MYCAWVCHAECRAGPRFHLGTNAASPGVMLQPRGLSVIIPLSCTDPERDIDSDVHVHGCSSHLRADAEAQAANAEADVGSQAANAQADAQANVRPSARIRGAT